jgi:hypothetical protein
VAPQADGRRRRPRPSSADRAGRHDAIRPAPAGAPRRPGCRPSGRPRRYRGRSTPPPRPRSATSPRSRPGSNFKPSSRTSVLPQPGRSRSSAPSAHPAAADPGCPRPPLSSRSQFATPPAHASCAPTANRQLTPPQTSGPQGPSTPTAAQNRMQPHAPQAARPGETHNGHGDKNRTPAGEAQTAQTRGRHRSSPHALRGIKERPQLSTLTAPPRPANRLLERKSALPRFPRCARTGRFWNWRGGFRNGLRGFRNHPGNKRRVPDRAVRGSPAPAVPIACPLARRPAGTTTSARKASQRESQREKYTRARAYSSSPAKTAGSTGFHICSTGDGAGSRAGAVWRFSLRASRA